MAFEENQLAAMKALEDFMAAFFRMAKEDGVEAAVVEMKLAAAAIMETIAKLEEKKNQIEGRSQ